MFFILLLVACNYYILKIIYVLYDIYVYNLRNKFDYYYYYKFISARIWPLCIGYRTNGAHSLKLPNITAKSHLHIFSPPPNQTVPVLLLYGQYSLYTQTGVPHTLSLPHLADLFLND